MRPVGVRNLIKERKNIFFVAHRQKRDQLVRELVFFQKGLFILLNDPALFVLFYLYSSSSITPRSIKWRRMRETLTVSVVVSVWHMTFAAAPAA
jgi:hypothetical protein